MALRFQAPGFLQPNQYEGIANLGNSLESIFDRYYAGQARGQQMGIQQEQMARQQEAMARERGLNLAQYGFDPGTVTPERLSMAQGNTMAGEDPGITALRGFLQRRKASEGMMAKKQQYDVMGARAGLDKTRAETAKLNAEAVGGGLSPEKRAGIEGSIMDDYMKSTTFANLAAAKASLRDLAAIKNNRSGAADIASIYSFIKTMDPNAVKEGETALVQSALPGFDRVKVIFDSLKAGNKITPEMKRELMDVAGGMYEAKRKSVEEFRTPFVNRAKQYGINPDIAVPDLSIPESEIQAMYGPRTSVPKPGEIVDGYIFNGGNPADPNSWGKQ